MKCDYILASCVKYVVVVWTGNLTKLRNAVDGLSVLPQYSTISAVDSKAQQVPTPFFEKGNFSSLFFQTHHFIQTLSNSGGYLWIETSKGHEDHA